LDLLRCRKEQKCPGKEKAPRSINKLAPARKKKRGNPAEHAQRHRQRTQPRVRGGKKAVVVSAFTVSSRGKKKGGTFLLLVSATVLGLFHKDSTERILWVPRKGGRGSLPPLDGKGPISRNIGSGRPRVTKTEGKERNYLSRSCSAAWQRGRKAFRSDRAPLR